MKRLIVALVAAVAVSAAFAKLTYTQGFEGESYDPSTEFRPSVDDEDASEVVAYDNDAPAFPAPYNFDNFGSKYLSLDTGDATLWRTNADEAAYFDMAMQFNPCASAPEIDEDTKIAIYLNSTSNLVVLAGDGSGGTVTNETQVQLAPGTWGRLTIAAVEDGFKVTLNTNTDVGTFTSRKSGDTTIKQVGFKGTGALDDFVARTTDPFIVDPAATVADGNEGYASLEEALAEADANTVITLGADHAAAITGLASGTTYKIANTNDFAFGGFKGADEVAVTTSGPDANGVTTYSAVEGVASLSFFDGSTWGAENWYATFDAAYAVAAADYRYANLKVKVGGDFVPSNITANVNFYNVTFVATTENPISIAMSNGTYNFYAEHEYVFPENATLNLPRSHSTDGISGGTLNIPSGVVLELASYATDGTSWNITGLTGSGTIKNDGKSMYYFLGNPDYNLPTRMRESTWCGTLELSGSNTWEAEFNKFANANSKVRFNGLTTPLWNSGNDTVAIELVGDGLTITNGTKETAASYAMGGTITGSGSLTFASSAAQLRTYNFTGDFSGFAGNLTIASGTQNRVYIGSNCTGNGACISIANGATATVAAGKTWNSQNGFVVLGTLNVAGTLKHQGGSAANQIYGTATTGKIVFKNAAAITTFGGSYAGEIVIDSIPAGGTLTQVPLSFGCSSAKLTLNGVSGNAWCAGSTYTVQPEVTLAGNVNFQNGSSDTAVTFRKIAAGTGNLSLKTWDGCRGVTYNFTEIDADKYSGTITLDGDKMTSTIGNIIKAGATGGAKVLNLVTNNSPKVNISSTTLNGAAAKLVQLADGIYLAVARVGDKYYATWAEAFANIGEATIVEKVADVNPDPSDVPAGWSVNGDGDYVKDVYKIRFIDGEGSRTNDYDKAYGETVAAPDPVAEVTGKSFAAWDKEIVSPVVGNAEYTALYTNNIYTVTVEGGENMTVAVYTNGVEEAAGAAGDYVLEYGDSILVEYTAAQDYKITTDTSTNIVEIVENVTVEAATVEACQYYTAVVLNKATTSIETNLTETLVATFTPESAADDSYTWASSDTSKATVDQNGVVTAIAAGTVTITVTADHDKTVTASCEVTVTATAPSSEDIPVLPENPTYDDVTNAVEKAQFVDDAVKTIINGDATTYNTFKAWADTVSGGEEAVVLSEHAAASFQLRGIVESPTLFENEPELTFTEIAPNEGNWDVTVELKDGDEAVQLTTLKANFASRVLKGNSLTNMEPCNAEDITAVQAVGETKKVKLTVTPPATGTAGFIKIKAE